MANLVLAKDKNGQILECGKRVKARPIVFLRKKIVGRVTTVGKDISRVRDDATKTAFPCLNRDIEIIE